MDFTRTMISVARMLALGLHLPPPMLRRALLRALEAVSASGAATPEAVGVFSMQCLRGEQSPAG